MLKALFIQAINIFFLIILTSCGGGGGNSVSAPPPVTCSNDQVLSNGVCVTPPVDELIAPYQVTLYVRGSMNNWEATSEAAFELIDDNTYIATLSLQAGTYEFKIADALWSVNTNFGSNSNAVLNQASTLNSANNSANITLTVSETRDYQFTLNAVNPNAPKLAITEKAFNVIDLNNVELFLRGSMNNWLATSNYSFIKTSDTTYSLSTSLNKGYYEFKIADESWAPTTNFGGITNHTQVLTNQNTLNVGITTSSLQMIVASSGNITFQLDISNITSPTLTITGELSELNRRAPGNNESFNQLRIYQIMVEAFQNGDDTVNYNAGWGNSQHKGDLKGITDALPYIKSLGMNAIWLTPIFDSESTKDNSNTHRLDATGYFTRNYFAIDPNFGTLDDAREMVNTAHDLGLYVFFDGVFGHHKGDPAVSPNGLLPSGGNNPVNYPQSLAFYQEVATYWIDELNIDGWRLDQADQVPIEMWQQIRLAVEAKVTERLNANETWGTLGYMVAERFSTNVDEITQQIYGSESLKGLTSAFDFPMRFNMVDVFAGNTPASNLHTTYIEQFTYPNFATPNLFLTNHDVPRFGDLLQRAGISGKSDPEYWARYKIALSFLAAYSGPITLYYGDEIGDEVEGFINVPDNCGIEGRYCEDHVSRSDGQISNFDTNQTDLKNYWTNLMTIRQQNEALWNGLSKNLMATDTSYVELKTAGNNKILYLINLAENEQTLTLNQELIGGNNLQEINETITISATNASYNITMPALTAIFFLIEE